MRRREGFACHPYIPLTSRQVYRPMRDERIAVTTVTVSVENVVRGGVPPARFKTLGVDVEGARLEDRRRQTMERARDEILGLDLARQAQLGGFACRELEGRGCLLEIPSFGGRIEIRMPEAEITVPPLTDSLSLRVLALRYVKLACGVPESGEWIAYRDLPGGRFYAATLVPTVEQPLARLFGNSEDILARVSSALGGARADYGDEAFIFHAFPRVPLLLVMHRGDEEFPPDCRVLFDRCCSNYLNTDDLKVLSTQLAAYLMKGAGEEADTENLLWMVE
jgi:hypothetical protein